MKYHILYVDPPWAYQDKGCNGNCEEHYKTLSIDDLCALPIKEISADNCMLFLWATYPMMKEALRLMGAWGFEYKSIAFQWLKKNKKADTNFYGLGRWTRGNTEPCLIGVKGKPERIGKDVSQLIESPIRGHSSKPPETRDKIVQLLGPLPRLEIFARERVEGWDAIGNEVDDKDIHESLKDIISKPQPEFVLPQEVIDSRIKNKKRALERLEIKRLKLEKAKNVELQSIGQA